MVSVDVKHHVYLLLFPALEQTHWAFLACDSQWVTVFFFYSAFWKSTQVVYLQCFMVVTWLMPRETAAVSARSVYTIQPCTMSSHFMQSHIRRVHACLAVTCHLHFGQNDRYLLHCRIVTWIAVTYGWNGSQNKSMHRKLTLEEKILMPGLEPETFQSRVRRCNQWAVPAPSLLQCVRSQRVSVPSGIFCWRTCSCFSLATLWKTTRNGCFPPRAGRIWRVACSLSVLKRSYVPGRPSGRMCRSTNSSMRKSGVCRLQLKQVSVAGTLRALGLRHPSFNTLRAQVYDILPSTHSEHRFTTSFLQHTPSTGLRHPSFNTLRAQVYDILPSTHSEHWFTTSIPSTTAVLILITPEGPESCQLRSCCCCFFVFLLVLKQ